MKLYPKRYEITKKDTHCCLIEGSHLLIIYCFILAHHLLFSIHAGGLEISNTLVFFKVSLVEDKQHQQKCKEEQT